MIEINYGVWQCVCNECYERIEAETRPDLHRLISKLGWVSIKELDEDWQDFCPDCEARRES